MVAVTRIARVKMLGMTVSLWGFIADVTCHAGRSGELGY